MAKRKFIETIDGKVSAVIDIPAGAYAGLLVRQTGTTSGGETLLLSDLGSFSIERFGQEIQRETLGFMHIYNDLKGGFLPTPTGGAAAAEDVFTMIPFYFPELPNALHVMSNQEMDLKYTINPTITTRFTALPMVMQVYGYKTEDIPELYQLIIRAQDVQAAGAGRLIEQINGQNLGALYLIDDGAVVDQYNVTVDGEVIVDNIDDAVERAITSWENQIEVATTIAELNMLVTGNPLMAQNKLTEVQLTFSGAGTAELTAFQLGSPAG